MSDDTDQISENAKWQCPDCDSDFVVRFGIYLECQECGNEWHRDMGVD